MISLRFPQRAALGLLFILVIGVVLRTWNLGGESLWLDEAHSLSQARRWWGAAWRNEALTDPNPPLYFTLLHFWVRMFGETEVALRALSVVFGTTTVAAVFVLGLFAAGVRLGLAGAALAATSPMLVIYSRETRGYALAILAATIGLSGALRLLAQHRDDHAKHRTTSDSAEMAMAWLAYAAGVVVALYTHTTLILLPVVVNAAVLAAWACGVRWHHRTVLAWLLANAAILVAYLPWLPNVLANRAIAEFWISSVSVSEALGIVRSVYGHPFLPTLQPWLDLTVMCLAAIGLAQARLPRPVKWTFLAVIVLPPLLTYIVSLYRPIFIPRVLLWPLPILLVTIAAGALRLPGRMTAGAVLAGCLVLQLVGLQDPGATTKREPWRDVARHLAANRQPGDIVFLMPAYAGMPFEYYAGPDRETFAVEMHGLPRQSSRWSYDVIGPDDILALIAERRRVWLVTRRVDEPSMGTETIAARMARVMPLTRDERFQSIGIRLFARQP